ncbi:MAG TPA: hypothetical protein DCZ10_16590 [Pelotomaculum sp.]|nr:hypothetical protein [Pelotomaculum sp.]
MPEKCQIIKTNVFASCETYNCLKRISWAIGRPDGPPQLHHYYCDDCMRDILASVPEELRPEPLYPEWHDGPMFHEPTPETEPIPEPPKSYPCKYCGEEFDSPTKIGSHTRYCEARKEAMANGET